MRNKQLVFAFVILPLAGVIVCACLAANARFTYRHPEGVVMDVRDGRAFLRADPSADEHGLGGDKLPVAFVQEDTYNFGRMDPLTEGTHRFSIRNDGDAPLILQQGETSCKCTLGALDDNTLAPGQETTVRLQWNTGRSPVYSHHADVHTNDPHRQRLTFKVEGFVRLQVGAEPAEVNLGDITPGESMQARVLIYSQIWQDFKITSGVSSLDGLAWDALPADGAALSGVQGRSGYWLTVTIPGHLSSGHVSDRLLLNVVGVDQDSKDEVAAEIEVPVRGKVLRRLALYGKEIDSTGTIDVGHVAAGTGTQVKLLAKVRDEITDLPITEVTTVPDFLSVSLHPYSTEDPRDGLVYLHIEIPQDAPECWYRGPNLGHVHVAFDHPRIKDLDLKVRFAVLGEQRKSRSGR